MKKESVCLVRQIVSAVLLIKIVRVVPLATILSTDIAPIIALLELISLLISTAHLALPFVLPVARTYPVLLAFPAIISSSTLPRSIALASKPAQLDTSLMPPVDGAKNACRLALLALQPPHVLNATPTSRSPMACASIRPATTAQPTVNCAQHRVA